MYSLVVSPDFQTLLILLSKCRKTGEAKQQGRPVRHLIEINSAILELLYYKYKSSLSVSKTVVYDLCKSVLDNKCVFHVSAHVMNVTSSCKFSFLNHSLFLCSATRFGRYWLSSSIQ